MKIHPAEQGTLEWIVARAGIPTASEFDALVTPDFKLRTGEMPKSYLAKKVAERWAGSPMPSYQTVDMDLGKILEEEALPTYELLTGKSVRRVGLCLTDDGLVGCSPDGLIGDDCGIECKCPAMDTHVKYVLGGVLPKDYAAQVHGAMFVTGRSRWVFMSYRRHFPPLLLTVERDDLIQEQLEEALAIFLRQMQQAMERMTEINGGPPRRPQPIQQKSKEQLSTEDIIP